MYIYYSINVICHVAAINTPSKWIFIVIRKSSANSDGQTKGRAIDLHMQINKNSFYSKNSLLFLITIEIHFDGIEFKPVVYSQTIVVPTESLH